MKRILITVLLILIGAFFGVLAMKANDARVSNNDPKNVPSQVTNFDECVAEGNPVMESYPRQCRSAAGQLFVEEIPAPIMTDEEAEKSDLIQLISPRPGETIESPVTVTGLARGYWFFEATFPISVVDWDGLIIGQGYATAEGDWMTENFVPFSAIVEYDKSQIRGQYSNRGSLILQKSNASGLPEHDDALEISIYLN